MNIHQYIFSQELVHTHLSQQSFTAEEFGTCLLQHQIAANTHEIEQIGTLLLKNGQISAQDPKQTRFRLSKATYSAQPKRSHIQGRIQPPIYDLVIVGGGYAGLSAAFRAVSVGLRIALIYEPHADYPSIIQRLRSRSIPQVPISYDDLNLDRLDEIGCDLYAGSGRFSSDSTIRIGDEVQLRFRKAIIATGSCRTSIIMSQIDDCISHCRAEDRVIVLGSIPRALEISCQISRLCSKVILLCKQDVIAALHLNHLTDILSVLNQAGVRVIYVSKFVRVSDSEYHPERGQIRALFLDSEGQPKSVKGNYIIDLIDNRASVQNLGLDLAGVKYSDTAGIQVDDFYVTSNRNICAIGDCITSRQYRSWDLAHYQGLDAVTNVFIRLRRCSDLICPLVLNTSPKIAHAIFVVKPFNESDVERYREPIPGGFLEIIVNASSGQIVSAFALGLHADLLVMSLAGLMPKDINLRRSALLAPNESTRSVSNIARRMQSCRASPYQFLLRRIYRRLLRILY